MTEIPGRRVNIVRFQIDKVRSNTDTAVGGPLSILSPDAAIARHIQLAQELIVFAPIRRDMALCHGEWRDTLTIEQCTVAVYGVTPFIQDPPADPSWVKATVEEGQVILRGKPNLEPFFSSYELYVMRDSEPTELLSAVP
jgi:hypothetical protein